MKDTVPRLARSSEEAHAYMRMRPCEQCGASGFDPDCVMLDSEYGLLSRYEGVCSGCGVEREFAFRLAEQDAFPDDEEPEFGDDRPSELLDPGEWLWLADMIARYSPADPDGLDARARRRARIDLRTAAAAVDEVLKFIAPGAEEVPTGAFWSDTGVAVHRHEPGRFRRGRLAVVRATYREIAERFA